MNTTTIKLTMNGNYKRSFELSINSNAWLQVVETAESGRETVFRFPAYMLLANGIAVHYRNLTAEQAAQLDTIASMLMFGVGALSSY